MTNIIFDKNQKLKAKIGKKEIRKLINVR